MASGHLCRIVRSHTLFWKFLFFETATRYISLTTDPFNTKLLHVAIYSVVFLFLLVIIRMRMRMIEAAIEVRRVLCGIPLILWQLQLL